MFDFLDKTGIKFLLEFVKSKLSGKSDSGHTHSKADITDFPASLPANGGNADTVNGRHCGRIATLKQDGNYWDASAENINDACLQWDGSKFFRFKTYGGNLIHTDNADTVDGLHADDFVNVNDRSQIRIPNNVDVPVWIYANGKRFQRYTTDGGNIGLANVPDNSTDYVWYWYDGLNILARDYSSGKYYICDMINGVFSGWKDVYTSGYKPYVTGVVSAKYGEKANVSFGFIPSMVLYRPANPTSNIPGSIYQATFGVDANGFTPDKSTYQQEDSCGFAFIAFK